VCTGTATSNGPSVQPPCDRLMTTAHLWSTEILWERRKSKKVKLCLPPPRNHIVGGRIGITPLILNLGTRYK
jgi:hypothetical protein